MGDKPQVRYQAADEAIEAVLGLSDGRTIVQVLSDHERKITELFRLCEILAGNQNQKTK